MSYLDPKLLETILSGIVIAAAFPIGAIIAIHFSYSTAKRALFAAFGAGIFFATVMLLVTQSLDIGKIYDLIIGFSLGVITFGIAEHYLRHRRRNENQDDFLKNKKHQHPEGRLTVIATILDSVPESLFIGILAALHQPVLLGAVLVLFMGNLATTLEGAKIMHNQGFGRNTILRDWFIDFLIVALAAPLGYFLGTLTPDIIAMVLSFAAGALIVFLAGELIARAYRESTGHNEDIAISTGFLIGVILLFVL